MGIRSKALYKARSVNNHLLIKEIESCSRNRRGEKDFWPQPFAIVPVYMSSGENAHQRHFDVP